MIARCAALLFLLAAAGFAQDPARLACPAIVIEHSAEAALPVDRPIAIGEARTRHDEYVADTVVISVWKFYNAQTVDAELKGTRSLNLGSVGSRSGRITRHPETGSILALRAGSPVRGSYDQSKRQGAGLSTAEVVLVTV